MKRLLILVASAAIGFLTPTTFAQQSAPSGKTQATPAPAEVDKQFAKMQERMVTMQEQMDKISKTQNPDERKRLLQDHWTAMQNMMALMRGTTGTMGQGPVGCCGSAGPMGGPTMMRDMMGVPMMGWGNYQNLTPDQLRQRQYMMDRMMPMHYMMMDHMMWHQQWMVQPPASSRSK